MKRARRHGSALREEFRRRRGYDLTPFLATFARREIGNPAATKKFHDDFEQTLHDLYREVYFATIQRECHAVGLECRAEPYSGPWKIAEVVPFFDQVSAEFWTKASGNYVHAMVPEVVAGARAAGMNLISAEAFTASPHESQWDETPQGLKPFGDAAFCDGVNRLMLHRFVHQPFDDRWRPGMAMGQWGTHFDRFQTWWEPGKAWVGYLQRCQAVLQWGRPAPNNFSPDASADGPQLQAVRRSDGAVDAYFVANLGRRAGPARCRFGVTDRQPELWNPVTGAIRDLPEFTIEAGATVVPLEFAPAESCFVVFRRPLAPGRAAGSAVNFPQTQTGAEIAGPWQVE